MKTNRIAEWILIVASLALLWTPTSGMILLPGMQKEAGSLGEFRQKAALPPLEAGWDSLAKFPSSFSAYYKDNFGFRERLISLYNFIETKIFKTISSRVLKGKDNWLYITENKSLTKYRALSEPLTKEKLAYLRQLLRERHAYLAKKGIRYLFVVVPEKDTIYPEHLPAWMKVVHPHSYLEQFGDAMKEAPEVAYLDLSASIRKGKSPAGPIYYETDTHWNELGAYYGYRAIAEKIAAWFPSVRPFSLSDFKIQTTEVGPGDLARIANIDEGLKFRAPSLVWLRPQGTRFADLDEFYSRTFGKKSEKRPNPISDIGIFAVENTDRTLPRAVIFRDSFSNSLIPFLKEHFSRSLYSWYVSKTDPYDFDIRIIEHEKPQIVIQEIGERIFTEIKANPDPVRRAYEAVNRGGN